MYSKIDMLYVMNYLMTILKSDVFRIAQRDPRLLVYYRLHSQ